MVVCNALTNGIKLSEATEQQMNSLCPPLQASCSLLLTANNITQRVISFSQQNRSNASPTLVVGCSLVCGKAMHPCNAF